MQIQSQSEFVDRLARGEDAEHKIARWLLSKNRDVLPVYEKHSTDYKGPRFHTLKKAYAAPDLLVFHGDTIVWVEAKCKTVFTWYRKKQIWETGIDRNLWWQYRQIAKMHPWPFWILFLHTSSVNDSPVGLFGNSMDILAQAISHETDLYGKCGMVYWAHQTLRKLATIEQVEAACRLVNL